MSSENNQIDGEDHLPLRTMSSDNRTESETPPEKPFDPNIYAITKTVAKGLLNVALLTNNANQLKITILEGPDQNPFYEVTITLAILSII